jgi:hypothetical protein
MRGRHKALIATTLGVVMTLSGVSLVDCAAPTQIVVEVYSDACPGGPSAAGETINQTGIAVGTAADIDNKSPAAFRDSCEHPPGVGTLTIYPSGSSDAEVAIKVIAGVGMVGPEQCRAPEYAGCILHRRVMRFVPNTTQRVTVRLSLACLNRVCAPGSTCDNGVCKAETDILPDGGTRADAATTEAGLADGAVLPMDAGADACAQCNGTCTSTGCAVDCKSKVCNPADDCSPTLPCTITCDGTGHCNDIRCNTNSTCTVNCGNAKSSCNKVTCNAATCVVKCDGANSCAGDGGISLDASTSASLTCSGDNACGTASCNSPDCTLSCNPNSGAKNACPSPAPCNGGCDNWNNASQ